MGLPITHFNAIRSLEIRRVLSTYGEVFNDKDVLEIGSGSGIQLQAISRVAKSVAGLELSDGAYIRDESLNIFEYDGLHIPFPSSSFDTVFSSNVMEHVSEQRQLNGEILRVLRPGGKVVHVMPTRVWRILTSLLHYPMLIKKIARRSGGTAQLQVMRTNGSTPTIEKIRNILIPAKHGELGNWFSEYHCFGLSQWRQHFSRMGWTVEAAEPIGLAYSGNCLLADAIGMETRVALSRFVGSSTAVFVLSRN